MDGEDAAERSGSLESLRKLRLTATLGDMIGGGGRVGTAETLGASYRTLVRAIESGRLTGRMSDALERAPGRRRPAVPNRRPSLPRPFLLL